MKMLILALALTPAVSNATLTPSLARGESIIQIAGRSPEICVIPTHPADGDYSKNDLDMEKALCGLTEDVNAAICPKMASTNPGVEFFTVPAGYTVKSAEIKDCFYAAPGTKDNIYKKVAKYKNSTSCSYTPSILAYYHVSRLLNNAGHVPPAVIRTLDLSRHLEIAQHGVELATQREGADAPIAQTWRSLLNYLNGGAASKKKDVLFTDAVDQSYGALQQNPTGEEKYSAFYTPAPYGLPRAIAFRDKNPLFQLVRNSRPVAAFVGTQFNTQNVQTVVQMKDIADFIVMDTLLSQEDRFGNIHLKKRYAYVDPSDIGKDGFAKVKFDSKLKPEIAGFHPVVVTQMLLKDNDCGVNRENRAQKVGLLDLVAHMDPKTYKGLLKLNQTIDGADMVKAFRQGMMFTAGDFSLMRSNLASIVNALHSRCVAGALKLDLDLDAHFSGHAPAVSNCEL